MHPIVRRVSHRFRHHALEVWKSRGGGFYGFVSMGTFAWLEAVNLVGDIAQLVHMPLDLGSLISWFVQNTVQGLMTLIWAAIWPVAWIEHVGAGIRFLVLLAVAYGVYRAIHPTVERLLRDEEEAA